ncbi:MAG: hypothetical protein IIA07_11345 [Proteobacteria bacterium]|nr:hypothetical protein [Pseudomonadota bacterium]
MTIADTEALIGHVQKIVRPVDELPALTEETIGQPQGSPDDAYPRVQTPWWVIERPADLSPISVDTELILENDASSTDFGNAVKDVTKNPNPDVYAFYCPFHFYRNAWGIYIKASGVLAISAFVLEQSRLSPSNTAVINSVFKLLLHHESFHYWTELACSRYEIPTIDFQRLAGIRYYPYESHFLDRLATEHEEAMANAHAFREVVKYHQKSALPSSSSAGIQSLLSKFMEQQPVGYRDFGRYLLNTDHRRGQDQIFDNLRETVHLDLAVSPPPSQILGRYFFSDRQVSPCPVYLVKDRLSSALQAGKSFPVFNGMRIVVHTKEHDPPHFHLESPIGNEIGRYQWPDLSPLKGGKKLSGAIKRKLEKYLRKYGTEIDNKIQKVFR